MPRNKLTRDEIKAFVLEQKKKLIEENTNYSSDPKNIAHRYLNIILDRIEEYRF